MISRDLPLVPQRADGTLPLAMEHTVRCSVDVEVTIAAIMSAMEPYPFAATDGFAVQLAVSEALNNVIERHIDQSDTPAGLELRVRTHITSAFIRVQIDDVSHDAELADWPRFVGLTDPAGRGLRLMRTYMTSVEFRKQGRQVILYRARGQGSAISSPPRGYDFQI